MRQALVTYKNEEAGVLTQEDDGIFIFRYQDVWFDSSDKPAISLTLPKSQQEYRSDYLFPFFFNMLPEGSNKLAVCYAMRIDEEDHFGLLLTTASYDTIGAVRVMKLDS
jgi:serine/threonine-protein kinase HipA